MNITSTIHWKPVALDTLPPNLDDTYLIVTKNGNQVISMNGQHIRQVIANVITDSRPIPYTMWAELPIPGEDVDEAPKRMFGEYGEFIQGNRYFTHTANGFHDKRNYVEITPGDVTMYRDVLEDTINQDSYTSWTVANAEKFVQHGVWREIKSQEELTKHVSQ